MLGSEMLTLRAAKGPDYYERAEFARDDYYEERGQVRGSWEGSAAAQLGLSGGPADGELGELLEGRDPISGEPLAGAGRRRGGNVAFDLTFTAPKSVSILAAVGDETTRQAVLAAQAAGALAALDYLERRACFVRRGRNGVEVLPGEGFASAMYLHEMARSGDPHLHAHLVVANRVKGPDGRWSAPDMRPVYAEAKTAGTIAEAVMRDALLRSLGLEWGPVRNGIAELVGVPTTVREHFSQRHTEIVEEALARGYSTPRGIDVIQRETRDRKQIDSRERAVSEWRARAAEHGFGTRELTALVGRSREKDAGRAVDVAAAVSNMLGSSGLTQRSSSFTRREVIQAFADAHPHGAGAGVLEDLADEVLQTSCVPLLPSRVDPGRGHQEALYSTPDILQAEVRLLGAATGVDPRGGLRADSDAVEAAIAARPILGEDQAAAVRHLCSGEARVRVMEARAGTGKTFALEAVRDAYKASDIPVIGTAWQGQAANVLQRDAGIPAQTTALLLERLARGAEDAIPAGAVIVCDETSMMPTRALERLAIEAAQRCARLILVGDRAQLPAIDAAGGFAALADRLGAAELVENRRQRTDLQRQVADRLATGQPADALTLLGQHGRLRGFDDARDARSALITAWAEASLADPSGALILAHDRHEVATLNRLAREQLDGAGLLGPTRLIAQGREWAAGDRLVCRRNDYRLGVRNGTRGTVIDIDSGTRALRVKTDDGAVVDLPTEYLENAHYGYAITGHISQGATVDRTYLLATPERGGAEWAYVASTRQRLDLTVFVVHHEPEHLEAALTRTWGRFDAKHLALDLAQGDARDHAVGAAEGQLERLLPERLVECLRDLRERRDRARADARNGTDEIRRLVGMEAQQLGEELRAVEASATGWAARSEVARPSSHVLSVLGPRPAETVARVAWDRAAVAVGAYRHTHSISPDEPTLLGPRPSAAEARSAWDATRGVVRGAHRELQPLGPTPERATDVERGRSRSR
jgi:conjugative relaxase-like TrwC/TraI family protein